MNEETKTYRLAWHGPVSDTQFDVDAFNEDDAKQTLAAWLNGANDLDDLVREVQSSRLSSTAYSLPLRSGKIGNSQQ